MENVSSISDSFLKAEAPTLLALEVYDVLGPGLKGAANSLSKFLERNSSFTELEELMVGIRKNIQAETGSMVFETVESTADRSAVHAISQEVVRDVLVILEDAREEKNDNFTRIPFESLKEAA